MSLRTDTSPDADRVYYDYLRSLTGEQRVQMAVDLIEEADQLSRDGIASRHPEYSPEQVHLAFLRLLLGDELFVASQPTAQLLDP